MPYSKIVRDVTPDDTLAQAQLLSQLINTCNFSGITVTVTSNHGLSVNNLVRFTGTLPSPVSINTQYYVLSDRFTSNTLEISNTQGGAPIVFSGSSGVDSIYKNDSGISVAVAHGIDGQAVNFLSSSLESWGVVGN